MQNDISNGTARGRADLHIHTTFSDGMYNPETVMLHIFSLNRQYKLKYGYHYADVIAVSDHDKTEGAFRAKEFSEDNGFDFEVIIGSEVSSREGHILAINIAEEVPRGLSAKDTVNAIHDQGGIAIAAHPYTLLWLAGVRGVGDLITSLSFDAVEIKNSNVTEIISNFYSHIVNSRNRKLPEVGNSDAHFLAAFEKVITFFDGNTKEDLLKSIAAGRVSAKGYHWGPIGLMKYLKEKHALTKYCKAHGIRPHNL